jgi:uncharacterized membrane protein YeaQ/YmgE (transglycosylase-associated protein family)
MGLLFVLLFGFFIGYVARVILPGPNHMSAWMTVLLGIAGSFLGWALGRGLGLYHNAVGLRPAGVAMSLVGAILLLAIANAVTTRHLRRGGDVRRPRLV